MLPHFFKTAWRNLSKTKSYSAITILGLATGLAGFIIILLYLNYELSYDKWDPELKKVYKVSLRSGDDIRSQTPAPLASLLAQSYPEAEASTAFQASGDYETLVTANEKKIYQKGMISADSSFLKVFPYKLVQGDPSTAFNQPDAVILSEEVSHKLFGDINPMGKTVKFYNVIDGTVTGIMQEPKGPSHLYAQILMRDPYEKSNKFWENFSYQTYIKLKHPAPEAKIENDINNIYYNERVKSDTKTFEEYKKTGQQEALFTDAVPNIHNFPKHGNSQFTAVSILLALAVLLLLAGAINFSNLAVAKSIQRAKEIGVRKVLGSGRIQLIIQFMAEIALQCMISLSIAIMVVYIALPYLNRSFNMSLHFWQQDKTVSLIIQIVLCLLLVIVLSGLYPSLFLSRYTASKVLKGDYSGHGKGKFFRNSLIVVQFIISAFFITAVLIVSRQMHYMQSKDKGFSGTQVLRIESTQKTKEAGFATARNILLSVPGVTHVAKTYAVPGDKESDTLTYKFKSAGIEYRMSSVKISTDYFNTLQIPLIRGRLFTEEYEDQNTRTAIINEAAAAKLNVPDPIGKVITFPYCDTVPVQIIGIVKDFNVHGFESVVQPVVYTIGNKACMYQSGGAMLVKLKSNNIQQSVAAITVAWKQIEPDYPIRYSFLDDNFGKLLLVYTRLQKIITFFAIVAIIISVMGLMGLTAFFTRQRTKEIGVRKVLGATVAHLTILLSREFIYLVLLSVLIVTPVAWWAMDTWLHTFAYRITIRWWMFGAAGFLTLLIALVTVSVQSIKVAVVNPVKSLRTE